MKLGRPSRFSPSRTQRNLLQDSRKILRCVARRNDRVRAAQARTPHGTTSPWDLPGASRLHSVPGAWEEKCDLSLPPSGRDDEDRCKRKRRETLLPAVAAFQLIKLRD